ncbi:riboflavin synthase [Virgibacillus halophilus]|uniref:Riboflavin synthase n=1 Tax=Tigheibacillus halophilus TaxID=361280 RepID=A0ABU5C9T3_9BACI|nr:riboflavin synthase [Virgibacillus halophilus]
MFTGIIQDIGRVRQIAKQGDTIRLSINMNKLDRNNLDVGDSIAVNGVCLTVSSLYTDVFTADVMPETFHKTNLVYLQRDYPVNLERSLGIAGRFDGHIVTGHVDATVELLNKKRESNALTLQIALPEQQRPQIVEKGSVALDGTSLTVIDVSADGFSISLIPHTQEHTILADKHLGDLLNIETDILGKYVTTLMNSKESGPRIDKSFLDTNGF